MTAMSVTLSDFQFSPLSFLKEYINSNPAQTIILFKIGHIKTDLLFAPLFVPIGTYGLGLILSRVDRRTS